MNRRGAILVISLIVCFAGGGWAGEAEQALRIRNLYQSGDVELADRMFEEFHDRFPKSAQLCPLLLKAGLAPRSIFEARQRLERVIEQCPDGEEEPEAMAELAVLQHLAGNDRASYLLCREFLALMPSIPRRRPSGCSKALWSCSCPPAPRRRQLRGFSTKISRTCGHAEALVGAGDSHLRRERWRGAASLL
jgi:hypothetical protein